MNAQIQVRLEFFNAFTMDEIWKDIPKWEGYYQVSNLGRVKSLERIITYSNNRKHTVWESIINPGFDSNGYPQIGPTRNNKNVTFKVHNLVASLFLTKIDGKPHVNHKNGIKHDNRSVNLEWVNARENTTHSRRNKSSKYTGVSWYKKSSKWKSKIYISRITYFLGYFHSEEDAAEAYKIALKKHNLENRYAR